MGLKDPIDILVELRSARPFLKYGERMGTLSSGDGGEQQIPPLRLAQGRNDNAI
jgi:hypothetical protein